MTGRKNNKKEEIEEQLDKLIENTRVQSSTLKKLIGEMEKRRLNNRNKESNNKEE